MLSEDKNHISKAATEIKTMRLLLAASLLLFASVNGEKPLVSTGNRSNNDIDTSRALQFVDNMDELPFALAGVPFFPQDAQEKCLSTWTTFLTCAKMKCPNGAENCPSSIYYNTSPKTVIDGTYTVLLAALFILREFLS